MNLTQNDRLNQITADTLVVGVDIVLRNTLLEPLTGEVLSSARELLDLAI